ncbi:flocculation protein FLO11-like isoform X2 [Echeneis naucrates]|uniref:Flocculation protein FLO11-like n=1 Tax=Echeneis naucrates TaxID=173247 RepID=A0A665UYX7_ECHNA|nr:flocculation protein FLO11-like isoform X2 [Echeneis naucrates]
MTNADGNNMAFANLFSSLSAVEDVRSPAPPAVSRRKRKPAGEHTGPERKKRYQPPTNRIHKTRSFQDDNCMQNTDRTGSSGLTKELIHNSGIQRNKGGRTNRNGCHQTRTTARRGDRNSKHRNTKKAVEVQRPRFMTEEFKDMNALLSDGRLLCKHFLWGRCIKGDDCQLEHIQSYNNLFKEVCKFYIQGFCMKGESCPYMHKSFPCKFFHRKGRCSQGADCKFSHEPLDEVTKRLLDEAIKRDEELARKTEQKSSAQPVDTQPEITVASTSDLLTQPLRPNFYNSGERVTQEALLCQTEHLSDDAETAVPLQVPVSAQPHSPPSANPNHKEPVCYSVEAVLGPQLFKPFPSFFTTPGHQDYAALSVPQTHSSTTGSTDQKEVPLSVEPINLFNSVGSSTIEYIPTPPSAYNTSYTSKTDSEDLIDPLLKRQEVNKSKEKMANHEEMAASLKPAQKSSSEVKLHPFHPLLTEPDKSEFCKGDGDLKGGTHIPMDITHLVNCKNDSHTPFSASKGKSLLYTPKHPTQRKPRVSGPVSKPQVSTAGAPRPSAGCSEFKGEAAVPAEPVPSSAAKKDCRHSVSHWFAAKQSSEIHQQSKIMQQSNHSESTAEGRSKVAYLSDVGCKETQRSPFYSLFAGPITDGLKPTPEPIPDCPQGLNQSTCPTLQAAQCRNKSDKASAKEFLTLFAAPLPCTQSQSEHSKRLADQTADLTDSRKRTSNSHTSLTPQIKSDVKQASHRPTSPKLSLSPNNKNKGFSEPVNTPTKLQVNPVCSFVINSVIEKSSSPTPCGDSADPSTTEAHQPLLDMSPPRAPAVAAAPNSVLRTLFLCLSPYQQDGEQHNTDQNESENKDKNTEFIVVKQQRKRRKKGRRKLKTPYSHQQLTEKTAPHSSGSPPSVQASVMEATVCSNLNTSAMTEIWVRNSDINNMPFKPVIQHHPQTRQKMTSEEGKQVNGNLTITPLKNLFKSLDTTVFHLGH